MKEGGDVHLLCGVAGGQEGVGEVGVVGKGEGEGLEGFQGMPGHVLQNSFNRVIAVRFGLHFGFVMEYGQTNLAGLIFFFIFFRRSLLWRRIFFCVFLFF